MPHAAILPEDPAAANPAARAAGGVSILDRNLAAMARCSPATVMALERTAAREGVEFAPTDDEGALTARVEGRWLASRRRPLEEADRLAATVDALEHAAPVILGFGVGHHVRAIARKIGRTGITVVFEPDLGLLRAVLERIDCADWLRECNVILLTDAQDAAAMTTAIEGGEGLLVMGSKIVPHAPSAPRLGEQAALFGKTFARVVSAFRTSLVTTLMQTETTIRNVLMNADHYVSRPGIADLEGRCAGRAAVVVAAGPSLARNIHLLAQPGVREKCVIVAVQTALKPLLEAGVRPHFVCALDHHEISARFYEHLTPSDVEGVTLIAEPKANPRILNAFPGAIRCPRDEFLERALGPELTKPETRGGIRPGATVAHLAYYLARYFGCDPVALIGQDLAFTDGQYYAAGAAIHNVWACELNPFRTLEMFEWERIARSRGILRTAIDHLGRHVWSDEQMMTYLAQFERDFQADETNGLLTIDATEGGVRKAHTERRTLADFLETYAAGYCPDLPDLGVAGSTPGVSKSARGALVRRLREVRAGVWRVSELSRRAEKLLGEMVERHAEPDRVNALIERVYAVRDEALGCQPAYELAHRFNQAGAFKRFQADRAIRVRADADEREVQKAQIERDRQNVAWLADSADSLGDLLDRAVRANQGEEKLTRDPSDAIAAPRTAKTDDGGALAALIPVDALRGPFGRRTLRPTSGPLAGQSLLRLTLERLAKSGAIGRAVLLTDNPGECEALVGGAIPGLRVEYFTRERSARRDAAVVACRGWAQACWRGGLGDLTVFDEILEPEAMLAAMEAHGLNAALLVGPDWACVDPALTSAIVERHRERPEQHRLTFTQAPPGLCGVVIDRHVMADLRAASAPGHSGIFASIGGLLSYVPTRPKADAIAQPICARVEPIVRDAGLRFIADTSAGRAAVDAAATALGERFAEATAAEIVGGAGAAEELLARLGPGHLMIDVNAERAVGGRRLEWARAMNPGAERAGRMTVERLREIVRAHAAARDDVVVTLGAAGDPALRADLPALVGAARDAGAIGVHVRTDLANGADGVRSLLAAAPDVVTVDLLAESEEVYAPLTGGASLAATMSNLEALVNGAAQESAERWLRTPLVVPRITRCDATYDEVQPFYDRWRMTCGAAVIDPLPAPTPGERIAPLPTPAFAAARLRADTVFVSADVGSRAALTGAGA